MDQALKTVGQGEAVYPIAPAIRTASIPSESFAGMSVDDTGVLRLRFSPLLRAA